MSSEYVLKILLWRDVKYGWAGVYDIFTIHFLDILEWDVLYDNNNIFIDLCFYNVYHFHCFMMSYLLLPTEFVNGVVEKGKKLQERQRLLKQLSRPLWELLPVLVGKLWENYWLVVGWRKMENNWIDWLWQVSCLNLLLAKLIVV